MERNSQNSQTSQISKHKVLIIGDGGVGKSTFLKHLRTQEFDERYLATLGVEVHPLYGKNSNDERITLEFWDCAGQDKFAGLKDGYYVQADAAIVMFSLCSRESFRKLCYWIGEFKRVCPNKPLVIVGTQADNALPQLLRRAEEENFVIISTKECPENDMEVIRRLTSAMNIDLNTESLTPVPHEIKLSQFDDDIPVDEEEDFVLDYLLQHEGLIYNSITSDVGLNSTLLLPIMSKL